MKLHRNQSLHGDYFLQQHDRLFGYNFGRNPRRLERPHTADAGLTLVELLIAMLLAAILSAGLFYMVSGQTTTYRSQMGAMDIQENLWGAIEYTQRHIRMAGYGFANVCPGGQVMKLDTGCATKVSEIVGLRVYDNCNLLTTAPGSCPDGSGSDSFVASSETGWGVGVRLAQPTTTSANPLKLHGPGGIQNGDFLVLSAPGIAWCTLVRATADATLAGAGLFDVATNADGVYNPATAGCTFPASGYPVQARAARFASNQGPRYFAIDRSQTIPRLVTWNSFGAPTSAITNKETVAHGIEDMQIAYACDDNTDSFYYEGADAAARQSDEWAYNAIGGDTTLPTCNPAAIGQVRLTLIARTESADPREKSGFRPAAENHAAGTIADDLAASANIGTFLRRQLTVLVQPRNL